ncbi:MAG TPA: hypothetical protein ENJ82_08015, partial [Bacteroidetes bacterium]|nr:hypothetical protein [Bacteroidota bacterium]
IEFKDIYLEGKKIMVATNASPFDMFFGQNTKFEMIRIPANKRTLYVKQLPATTLPRANMVGKFKMTAELNSRQVNTGDNLELKVNIKGNGNIAMMAEPVTGIPETFEYEAPNSEYSSRTTDNSFYGDKTFTYSLVPTRSGKYDLGPLKFFYLNPKSGTYDSLVVANIPVQVTGDDLDNLVLKKSGLDRFYETALSNSGEKLRGHGQSGVWAFLGILLLLGGAVVFRLVRKPEKDVPQEDSEADWRQRFR